MAKFKNIEFLRFVFSLIIVHFHLYSSIGNTFCTPFYQTMGTAVRDGYLVVEMFFILSGFFLGRNYQRDTSPAWTDFAVAKIIRMWPLAAFIWLFDIAAYQNFEITYTAFLNLFFLQSTGLVLNYRLSVLMWFISALFWVLLFYYYLLKNFDRQKTDLLIALIVFFSYVAVINHNHGALSGAGGPVIGGIFNLGILRALAGVGLGYFLFRLYHILSMCNLAPNRKAFVLFSLIEAGCLLFILVNTVFRHISYSDKFVFIPVFSWLMLSFCLRLGIVSRLLENDFSQKLGRYAYAIYVMQVTAFYICNLTLWKSETVMAHPLLNITLSLAIALSTGIAGYHFIEVPAKKILSRRKSEN